MTAEQDLIRAVKSFTDALRDGDTLANIDQHRADDGDPPHLILESRAGLLSSVPVPTDDDLDVASQMAGIAYGVIRGLRRVIDDAVPRA
jgi:hypothetical protein